MGTGFAYDTKAYGKWRRRPSKTPQLDGAALEAAVMRVAEMFPDNVERVAA